MDTVNIPIPVARGSVPGYVPSMRTQLIEPTFESWRDAARNLWDAGVEADAVLWSDDVDEPSLFAGGSDRSCFPHLHHLA